MKFIRWLFVVGVLSGALVMSACGDDSPSGIDGTYTMSQMYQYDTMAGWFRKQAETTEATVKDGVFRAWEQVFPLEDCGQGEFCYFEENLTGAGDDMSKFRDFSELRLMFTPEGFYGTVVTVFGGYKYYHWSSLKGAKND